MKGLLAWFRNHNIISAAFIIILVASCIGCYNWGKVNGENEQIYKAVENIIDKMDGDSMYALGHSIMRFAIYLKDYSETNSYPELYYELSGFFLNISSHLSEYSSNVSISDVIEQK